MGYFSNGEQGDAYEEKWCLRCVHQDIEAHRSCPCLEAHALWNYEECNKLDSVLHKMIPREWLGNAKCIFFGERIPCPDKPFTEAT